jgi:hypothetical protein
MTEVTAVKLSVNKYPTVYKVVQWLADRYIIVRLG